MVSAYQHIIIIRTRRDDAQGINDDLKWFCNSLGMFNQRDKDNSCYRIFVELLKSTRSKRLMSSDGLAYRLGLSRGTVVHHLNKLIESGFVVCERNKYSLRADALTVIVDELEEDTRRALMHIRETANKIDNALGTGKIN